LLAATLLFDLLTDCSDRKAIKPQPVLGTRSVNIIEKKGLQFKDLNKNGELDPYEDWRLPDSSRLP